MSKIHNLHSTQKKITKKKLAEQGFNFALYMTPPKIQFSNKNLSKDFDKIDLNDITNNSFEEKSSIISDFKNCITLDLLQKIDENHSPSKSQYGKIKSSIISINIESEEQFDLDLDDISPIGKDYKHFKLESEDKLAITLISQCKMVYDKRNAYKPKNYNLILNKCLNESSNNNGLNNFQQNNELNMKNKQNDENSHNFNNEMNNFSSNVYSSNSTAYISNNPNINYNKQEYFSGNSNNTANLNNIYFSNNQKSTVQENNYNYFSNQGESKYYLFKKVQRNKKNKFSQQETFNPFQNGNEKNILEDNAKKRRQFTQREGDWVCMKCKNKNFSFRSICNRCTLPKN